MLNCNQLQSFKSYLGMAVAQIAVCPVYISKQFTFCFQHLSNFFHTFVPLPLVAELLQRVELLDQLLDFLVVWEAVLVVWIQFEAFTDFAATQQMGSNRESEDCTLHFVSCTVGPLSTCVFSTCRSALWKCLRPFFH